MADRSPRFAPGWWLLPAFVLGAAAWAALIRAGSNLLTGGA